MFFDKFNALCQQKGISCKKAAEEIGLSNSITTKWKKVGTIPDGATLVKIASFFGVSVDYLLDCHGAFAAYLKQYYTDDTAAAFAQKCGINKSLLDYLGNKITGTTPYSPSQSQTVFGTDDIQRVADTIGVDFKYLLCLYDGCNPAIVRGVSIPENDLSQKLSRVDLQLFGAPEENKKTSPNPSEEVNPTIMKISTRLKQMSPDVQQQYLEILERLIALHSTGQPTDPQQ